MLALGVLFLAASSVIATPVAEPEAARFAGPLEARDSRFGSLVVRDETSINNSISAITSQLETLNSSVAEFTPGVVQTISAVEIVAEGEELKKTVDDATSVVEQSADLNTTESYNIAVIVLELADKVYSVLDLIVDKKSAFDEAILGILSAGPVVKSLLESLDTATVDFGDALTDKLSTDYAEVAPTIVSSIEAAFATAIAAYS